MMRVGFGYDVHAFESGDYLMLCGVKVPFDKSFKAHSDGDVAIHALIDALLGAVALGDIGLHYPDTDGTWKDAASVNLLKDSYAKVQAAGFKLGNVDMTIVAEAPKLRPYVDTMRETLADALAVSMNQINIKATTSEKMGFIGRTEGVAVHTIASVFEK